MFIMFSYNKRHSINCPKLLPQSIHVTSLPVPTYHVENAAALKIRMEACDDFLTTLLITHKKLSELNSLVTNVSDACMDACI